MSAFICFNKPVNGEDEARLCMEILAQFPTLAEKAIKGSSKYIREALVENALNPDEFIGRSAFFGESHIGDQPLICIDLDGIGAADHQTFSKGLLQGEEIYFDIETVGDMASVFLLFPSLCFSNVKFQLTEDRTSGGKFLITNAQEVFK